MPISKSPSKSSRYLCIISAQRYWFGQTFVASWCRFLQTIRKAFAISSSTVPCEARRQADSFGSAW